MNCIKCNGAGWIRKYGMNSRTTSFCENCFGTGKELSKGTLKNVNYEDLEKELEKEIYDLLVCEYKNNEDIFYTYNIVQTWKEGIKISFGEKGLIALERAYTGAIYNWNVKAVGEEETNKMLD